MFGYFYLFIFLRVKVCHNKWHQEDTRRYQIQIALNSFDEHSGDIRWIAWPPNSPDTRPIYGTWWRGRFACTGRHLKQQWVVYNYGDWKCFKASDHLCNRYHVKLLHFVRLEGNLTRYQETELLVLIRHCMNVYSERTTQRGVFF